MTHSSGRPLHHTGTCEHVIKVYSLPDQTTGRLAEAGQASHSTECKAGLAQECSYTHAV